MTGLSILFSGIAVLTVAICTWIDSTFLSLLLPALVILVYVGCGWNLCAGSAEKFHLLADQVYFLGYLCTITALGGLLWRSASDQTILEKPEHVLHMGGIALTNIVLSLTCMMGLKSHAQSLEVNVALDAKKLEAFFEKLRNAMESSNFIPVAGALAITLQKTLENFTQIAARSQETTKAVDSLNSSVVNLGKSVSTLHTSVSATAPKAVEFAKSVKEVDLVLVQFVELVKRQLDKELAREETP
ncbi:hypothetical protein [Prosthecobacter sp.]|uniref:hypothetical protein n=1 Tax=Prosthecobacter sp. TaxID=1965333 RepID=UPI003784B416